MDSNIIIGTDGRGQDVPVDIEELLATRLLVQGNSGSGKSHLLRRLLEESADMVQQVVIDPEGDFVSLADMFPHVVIDGASHSVAEIAALARRTREHRASVVLALEGLDVEQQIRCAAHFLAALFDTPREHWYPALVVVDEAQMFAPAASGEISEETRRLSMNAMTNLMCRGRKRGLAGIVATQRLAKLAKNVAAEASNFLMGRTFLDIDMIRAADLLGMERRQAEQIRDLDRGQFLGLGPAITRRPLSINIGPARSGVKGASKGLLPLPVNAPDQVESLLHDDLGGAADTGTQDMKAGEGGPVADWEEKPEPLARNMDVLEQNPIEASVAALPGQSDADTSLESDMDAVIADLAARQDSAFQPASSLYQSFTTEMRKRGSLLPSLDMAAFRRRYALALAGIPAMEDDARRRLNESAHGVDDDVLAPFMLLARHAYEGLPQPDEDALARVYGTSSPGRLRRMLSHLESLGLIVIREEYGGERTIIVPGVVNERAA
ncbi:ATP-binding protein [Altererythrobacter sp. ZODW24]|uniref:ATP-binding protein n=1 Tax=Altererythrobacter sp. ZODW24 TaxID=2185142 RepID=UPI000DF86843|nr:ATP-binding protein [Altererythrobacter sp. ZODW24]